jgi:Amt family ammonium transporter
MIPLLALRGRAPALVAALGGVLVGAFLYPLAGNWVWGGGWLANLGLNLGLGHGFVDFAGSGLVHLLGAAVAWAGIISFLPRRQRRASDQPAPLPPVHLPLLATLGAFLLIIGGVAWLLANPLLAASTIDPSRLTVNLLLATAAGAFLPLAYTWSVANRPDPLMAARGLAAGLVAISGSVAFVPSWAALLIGAVAGLLTPLACFAVDHVLRWDDRSAALTVHGIGGLWGLVAVALFADGTSGLGWNRIGAGEYLQVSGQGVSGLLTAAGYQPDWPGQMQAQAVGLAAVGLFAFVVAGAVFGPLAGLMYTARNPPTLALRKKRGGRRAPGGSPQPSTEANPGGTLGAEAAFTAEDSSYAYLADQGGPLDTLDSEWPSPDEPAGSEHALVPELDEWSETVEAPEPDEPPL